MENIDTEFLRNCRREAYVLCSMQYMESNNVVGFFGENFPLELFYGFGLIPVPLEDVDREVFQFASTELINAPVCDCIKSTLVYLTTDKCPILFSCKAYVFNTSCKTFFAHFSNNTTKPCFFASSSELKLKNILSKISENDFDSSLAKEAKKKLDNVNSVISKCEKYSSLNGEELFLLRYYTPYIIDLDERVKYFEKLESEISFSPVPIERPTITMRCPRGYLDNLLPKLPKNARLIWGDSECDFSDCHCFEKAKNFVSY